MPKLSGPMLPPRSGGAARHLVVLLHGYGADGRDLIDLGRIWGQTLPDAQFFAPNAPDPCDENPYGFQWFPLDLNRGHTWAKGVPSAAPVIEEFLADLWKQSKLTPSDTFLCGFSQGAMMALHVGTSLHDRLKGVLAFSGAFVAPAGFGSLQLMKPPIALIHGDTDPVVNVENSVAAAEELKAVGYDVSLHVSPQTGHTIAADGLDFGTAFIRSQTD